MKIALANDTGSFELKESVRLHLAYKGIEMLDFGTLEQEEAKTYVQAAKAGAKALQDKKADLAILFCGSGAGVMTVANKFKGVYAVVSESPATAKQARVINNANTLCMGAGVVDKKTALEMTDLFISTDFAEGADCAKRQRLEDYINEIIDIENLNYK